MLQKNASNLERTGFGAQMEALCQTNAPSVKFVYTPFICMDTPVYMRFLELLEYIGEK